MAPLSPLQLLLFFRGRSPLWTAAVRAALPSLRCSLSKAFRVSRVSPRVCLAVAFLECGGPLRGFRRSVLSSVGTRRRFAFTPSLCVLRASAVNAFVLTLLSWAGTPFFPQGRVGCFRGRLLAALDCGGPRLPAVGGVGRFVFTSEFFVT